MKVWIAHAAGVQMLGSIPPGVQIEVYDGNDQPSDPASVEVWMPPFLGAGPVVELAEKMTALRLVQLASAGADAWVGRLPESVTLCDARGVHDSSTAEWVLTAILSYLRDFPVFVRAQAQRRWAYQGSDELAGKRVLIVGAGSIGTAIARRLAPFEATVTLVGRRARPGVYPVEQLPSLLPEAEVVVLVVPLTAQTTGLVDAAFLAAMPDGALLVNAARGPIVQTGALVAELATGRLGAALDVTDPEPLPVDHPIWTMPNVLLTPHVAGSVRGLLPRAYRLVGEQLRRYVAGQPLANVVVDGY